MALLGMLACNLGRLARNAFGKDLSKPDGTPRKLLSAATRVAMRRRPATCLADGLAGPYADWLAHGGSGARREARTVAGKAAAG